MGRGWFNRNPDNSVTEEGLSMEETIRRRFWAAKREKDAVLAKTQPVRDKREALVKKIQPTMDEIRALDKQLREIEAPLFDLSNEMGFCAKALDGKTGEAV